MESSNNHTVSENSLLYSMAAKLSSDGNRWLPIKIHLADTAGIIEKLIVQWLPGHMTYFLTGGTDPEQLVKIGKFLALTHDIGKMTAYFQSMISKSSEELREKYTYAGLELPLITSAEYSQGLRHGTASEAILLKFGISDQAAAIVGAHHGMPSMPNEAADSFERYEGCYYGISASAIEKAKHKESPKYVKTVEQFHELWKSWISFALEECGFQDASDFPDLPVAAQMLLSGLLIMADWIASNEKYAPLISIDEDGRDISYAVRQNQIWDAGFWPDPWIPNRNFFDTGMFLEEYGFPPNAMQDAVLSAVENARGPGLYILEAPMGVGKTEAALAAAEILASKEHCEGVFFGLPTQATANGMFARFVKWGEEQVQGGDRISVRLVHGSADLQDSYRALFEGSARQEEDRSEEDCPAGSLVVHDWFSGRKQALLSSFVIGTIDQLLMMSLKQKHVMLRHIGMAGKVVIIDECHAYDTYMTTYLDNVLGWLGVYKVPVILLSATLPARRRADFVKAYAGIDEKRKDRTFREVFSDAPDGWERNEQYPLLTYTDQDTLHQEHILLEGADTDVKIEKTTTEACFEELERFSERGGCIGIIVNTVGRSQEMAERLSERFGEENVLLIHSRFTMGDRKAKEQILLQRAGKESKVGERNLIVVGTQVLEQSLDIDFDFLITELAPMDLLLQRIGRLHRHKGRERPTWAKNPRCLVLHCNQPDESSVAIYGRWLLERTSILLPKAICLPKDISPLVQKTYADDQIPEEQRPIWEEYNNKKKIQNRKAKGYCLEEADRAISATTFRGLLSNTLIDGELNALARVRDGDIAIRVILMIDKNDGYLYFPTEKPDYHDQQRIGKGDMPSVEEAGQILEQQVALPRWYTVGQIGKTRVNKAEQCIGELEALNKELSAWQESPLIRGELVLPLNEKREVMLCGRRLIYSQRYGLIMEKEEKK